MTRNKNLVYIENISYSTTEGELEELFRDFEPTFIFVPSYVARLTGFRRNFGVAYVAFDTEEGVEKAIEGHNGKILKNRTISLCKYSDEVTAKPTLGRRVSKLMRAKAEKNVESPALIESIPEQDGVQNDQSTVPKNSSPSPQIEKVKTQASPRIEEPSNDTLFVHNLAFNTSEKDLESHFEKWNVKKVVFYRTRHRFSLKTKTMAFVQLTVPEDQTIEGILEEYKNPSFIHGRKIRVAVAFKRKAEKTFSREAQKSAEITEPTSNSPEMSEEGSNSAESGAQKHTLSCKKISGEMSQSESPKEGPNDEFVEVQRPESLIEQIQEHANSGLNKGEQAESLNEDLQGQPSNAFDESHVELIGTSISNVVAEDVHSVSTKSPSSALVIEDLQRKYGSM